MISAREIGIKAVSSNDDYAQLYIMLAERNEISNISHKKMPTWSEHLKFVKSSHYKEWFLVLIDEFEVIGQFYVTNNNEIGIQVLKAYQNKGYGTKILELITTVRYKDDELLANINPKNEASIKLFQKFGFNHIQNTYRRDVSTS